MIREEQEAINGNLACLLRDVTFHNLYNARMDTYLTYAEAAERLGVSRMQIWRLVRDGVLEAHPNPMDRREKLVTVAAIEELESIGRRKRKV
jgi:predicted DNA-binding transcriptional regulator AlpA